MQNLKRVYLGYKLHMPKQVADGTRPNIPVATHNAFEDIFRNQFNIGFHCPKKDKCIKCEKFKNIPTEMQSKEMKQEYKEHQTEKNATYAQHKRDQELHNENSDVLCASFDLQKVLNTPHGESVLLFYSRKYAMYNFSVYESCTRRGFCYVWGEADAKRGAFEISTCLYKWITSVDNLKLAKNVILCCDCCSGQNRNRVVVAMLRYALINCSYIETVCLKFLLPGHTYMPVDSVHASIEHFVRKRIVWAPSEWPTVIRSARIDPEPYTVITMGNDSFLNWGQIQRTIMPSKCRSDVDNHSLRWKSVRAVAMTKTSAKFEVRYSMVEDAVCHTFCFPRCSYIPEPKQLYRQTLSISVPKFRDLQHLCATSVIPGEFHRQFLGLKAEGSVRDCLPETDEEDNVESK